LAAGLCALSVALVFGGFGVPPAAADTETDASVSDAQGVGNPAPEAGTADAEPGAGSVTPAVVDTVPGLIGAFDGGALFGHDHDETQQETTSEETSTEPAALTGPMALGVTGGEETVNAAASVVENDNKGSDSPASAAADETNAPEVVVSHSPVTEPSQEPEVPAEAATSAVDNPPAEQLPEVRPLTDEAAPVEEPNPPVEADVAQPVVGAAAAGDIIKALAYFFITLPGAGFPLMGDGATTAMSAGGIGGSLLAGGLSAVTRTRLASARTIAAGWQGMLSGPGAWNALSPEGASAHRSVDNATASGVEEVHLSAVLADATVPTQVQSVIRHAVGAVLAPLSLLVLAVTASPGLAGLVLLSAAGTFVGYRQARAASILRAVSIARFVKSGPLGVVRSGSFVALRPRMSRPADEQPRHTKRHLESVA
jgi:hypothetical protein